MADPIESRTVSVDDANRVLAEERTEHGHTMRRLGIANDLLRKVYPHLPLGPDGSEAWHLAREVAEHLDDAFGPDWTEDTPDAK